VQFRLEAFAVISVISILGLLVPISGNLDLPICGEPCEFTTLPLLPAMSFTEKESADVLCKVAFFTFLIHRNSNQQMHHDKK